MSPHVANMNSDPQSTNFLSFVLAQFTQLKRPHGAFLNYYMNRENDLPRRDDPHVLEAQESREQVKGRCWRGLKEGVVLQATSRGRCETVSGVCVGLVSSRRQQGWL